MSFIKTFQRVGGLADSSSKTAKTGTLTLGGGKPDFALGKPPLSPEETRSLLRQLARLIIQQTKVLRIFKFDDIVIAS